MCFPKASVPNTADELRASEEKRAAQVRETSGAVNQAFDESYSPSYYGGIGNAYRDYYKPQVDEQFKDAGRATTFRFANNADSSAAHRTLGELYRDRIRADQNVESGATSAMSQAKQDVEGKRASLIGLAEAGGSMENTAALARSAATQHLGQPTFSPLGDLFSKYTNTVATAARASDSGQPVNPFFQKQVDFLRGGSGGSQSIVKG